VRSARAIVGVSAGGYGATLIAIHHPGKYEVIDPGFAEDNVKLSEELTDAGVPHVFRIYEGAHNEAFWSQHQDEWLAAAVERLDRPA